MIPRELVVLRKVSIERDKAFADVLRQLARRDEWLRTQLVALYVRVRAIDGLPLPDVQPWPQIEIPPALKGLLSEED